MVALTKYLVKSYRYNRYNRYNRYLTKFCHFIKVRLVDVIFILFKRANSSSSFLIIKTLKIYKSDIFDVRCNVEPLFVFNGNETTR